jgi:hypothetical protein
MDNSVLKKWVKYEKWVEGLERMVFLGEGHLGILFCKCNGIWEKENGKPFGFPLSLCTEFDVCNGAAQLCQLGAFLFFFWGCFYWCRVHLIPFYEPKVANGNAK